MSDAVQPSAPPGKAARNERRKAAAATLNAIGVAAFIASAIQPMVSGVED